MTETCSGISGFWLNDHPSELCSAGEPFDGVSISIVDNNIAIDSKMNMRGYYMEKPQDSIFITSEKLIFDEYLPNIV